MACDTCGGTGRVGVKTPNGVEAWVCGDCSAPPGDVMTEAEVASAIRGILIMAGVNGMVEEVGAGGDLRVTMSVVLPVGIAEEVVELVRANTIRT